jgi:hypothetical protein
MNAVRRHSQFPNWAPASAGVEEERNVIASPPN